VNAACFSVYEDAELIDVCVFELAECAVFENEIYDGVLVGKLLQDSGVGALTCFAETNGLEAEAVKQNIGKLLW